MQEISHLTSIINKSGNLLQYLIDDMIDLLSIQKGNLKLNENFDFNPV